VNDGPVKPGAQSGRAARWAGHRQRRRAELVDAAVDAIREHGAGASVATIAAQAGVTKPVLYRHFTDRADLQRAVSERAAEMLLGNLLSAVTSERPPVERVRAIVGAFLAATEEEPELWRFVVHNPAGSGDGPDVVAHNIALVAGLITSALVDELRSRGKDAGGAEAWAFGLAGMVYTAGDWWLQRRTMSRSALTDYLTNLIWGGLVGVLGPGLRDSDPASRDKAGEGSAEPTGDTGEARQDTTADGDQQTLTERLRLVAGMEEDR
jgi:AcrR family transcriptional regulator